MQMRKKEGRPLKDTEDMKMWREEFKEMSLEEHDKVLKNLGLDKEDIEDFNETVKKGGKIEDLLGLGEDANGANGADGADGAEVEKGVKGKKRM